MCTHVVKEPCSAMTIIIIAVIIITHELRCYCRRFRFTPLHNINGD